MQTENILKFLSYAGPRLDYLEKRAAASMEKQAGGGGGGAAEFARMMAKMRKHQNLYNKGVGRSDRLGINDFVNFVREGRYNPNVHFGTNSAVDLETLARKTMARRGMDAKGPLDYEALEKTLLGDIRATNPKNIPVSYRDVSNPADLAKIKSKKTRAAVDAYNSGRSRITEFRGNNRPVARSAGEKPEIAAAEQEARTYWNNILKYKKQQGWTPNKAGIVTPGEQNAMELERVRSANRPAPETAAPAPTPETPAPTPEAPAPTGSWWNDTVTAHPIAAPATTAGVTGAAAGGFGYGIGNANGKDDGAQMAQHYIMMQNLIEQLREQKNKGFFSGLSNFLA